MTRVLVVDDEPQILRALRVNLLARGYEVVTAGTGAQAQGAAVASLPDLVVLDLGLPDMEGVEVIRSLRSWSSVPILVLSGRLRTEEKIAALDAGADDYVTKPFSVDELLARVRAVSRRYAPEDRVEPCELGAVTVDLTAHQVTRGVSGRPSEPVHLTRTEWQLLEVLLRNPGRLVTQRELIRELRGPRHDEAAHYVRQYMAQLRSKLEVDSARPRYLLTEPGMGYRFQPDETSPAQAQSSSSEPVER